MKNRSRTICLVFAIFVIFISISNAWAVSADDQIIENEGQEKIIRVVDDKNYPPYSYLDEKGNPTGFNIDLIKAIGQELGYRVEIELLDWPDAVKALETGRADLISGMFVTETRKQDFVFSVKHSVASGDLFSWEENRVESLDDLNGETVVVVENDIMQEYLLQVDSQMNLVKVGSSMEALRLVEQGIYKYAGFLKPSALYLIETNQLKRLTANGQSFAPKEYAIAARKEQTGLIDIVNAGLHSIQATGVYDEIYNRWLGVYQEYGFREFVQDNWFWFHSTFMIFVLLLGSHFFMSWHLKKKESELKDSYQSKLKVEENLWALLHAVPDLILQISKEGKILDYAEKHPWVENLLQHGPLEDQIDQVIAPEHRNEILSRIRQAIHYSNREQYRFEAAFDGFDFYLESRIVRMNEDSALVMVRDMTQMRKDEMRIRYLAEHDSLTSVKNRQYLDLRIQELDTEGQLPISLIMVDINGLKVINDSLGHSKGDETLLALVEILRKYCPADSDICRVAGDEFVILMPGYTYEKTRGLVKQIRHAGVDQNLGLTNRPLSIGWATKENLSMSLRQVLRVAEDFLYKEKILESDGMHGQAVNAIMVSLYEKNRREENHSQRVSVLCYELAKAAKLNEVQQQMIRTLGLLHDIGKIAIPEQILNKPGRLTEDEYQTMKQHSEIGFRILGSMQSMADMAEFVLCHHERWDGHGYPRGLAGEEIPVLSRIITIVDAYDAMTCERSYKRVMTKEEAVEEIQRNLGTQFDPVLGQIFIDHIMQIDAMSAIQDF